MIDLKTLRLITQDGLHAFAAGHILDGIAVLRTLLPYCAAETVISAEVESLGQNYHYMLSFLRQGGDDQKRSDVQAKIQRQGIALLEQASRAIRISIGTDLYSKALKEKETILKRWNSLLTPEETSEVQDDLFDLLWTSPLWTAQDTAFWYDFLLGQRDMVQQHLAGALFLSAWEYLDAEKLQLLGLLADSQCHRTRITAVVYLLLLRLHHKEMASLMPSLPDSILSGKGRQLIVQVQYEMLLMLVSEKDMERELKEAGSLTKELMQSLTPTLSEGEGEEPNPFAHFLKEKGKAFAESVKGMISLRGRYLRNRLQRGLDINLSKIPLLHSCKYLRSVSHWFLPFDKTHPLFQSVMIDEKGNEKQNLSTLVDLILDCDVDKLATLYLVANDKDFFKAVQQLDDQALPEIAEPVIPEYTIRLIMQDLYRFFGHSPLHSQLANPFRSEATLFDFSDIASMFSSEDCIGCCRLLLELGRLEQALNVLDMTMKRDGVSASALLLKGEILRKQKLFTEAVSCARNAEILEPDNTDILRFLVECYARQNRYDEELEYLQRLAEQLPDDKTLQRLIPITLTKLGRDEEALGLFFKLDYEYAEDSEEYLRLIPLIAETALRLGKLDIAERYTEKELELSDGKKWKPLLRKGHIKLLNDNWKDGLGNYEQFINLYCEEKGKDIKAALAEFSKSQEFLISKGIKQEDLLLIHDILQAASENPY